MCREDEFVKINWEIRVGDLDEVKWSKCHICAYEIKKISIG